MSEKQEMVSLDVVNKCINHVFTNFASQEMGNKISSFNLQGLASVLLTTIKNPHMIDEKETSNKPEK
jgi:hypothetical protein